jgi:type VI secretion system secreted protein Hcp
MQQFLVTIKGARQGQFKGELHDPRHAGEIGGLRLSMGLDIPRDPATGQASGKRKHQPLTITKEWGAASFQILQAAITNEVLTEVQLKFVNSSPTGAEDVTCTVTLTNAGIAAFRRYIGEVEATSGSGMLRLEDMSFTFERIVIQDLIGHTSFTDSWSTPA